MSSPYGSLRISIPSKKSKTIPVTNETITLGRDPNSTIHLPSILISKLHLTIYCTIFDEETAPLIYVLDNNSTNGTLLNDIPLATTARLLLSNDVLHLPDGTRIIFTDSVKDPFTLPAALERDSYLFSHYYTLTNRVLGTGGFGTVFLAISKTSPSKQLPEQVACKAVDLKKIDKTGGAMTRSKARREVELLASLSHPNVVSIQKVLDTGNMLYIFEELVPSGDLFSLMEKRGAAMEDYEAMAAVWQILEGLEYLHSQGVAHRDLKPENILCSTSSSGGRLLISDFGCSRRFTSTRMKTEIGTPDFVAPEVSDPTHNYFTSRRNAPQKPSGYSCKVDMWSLGVVVHILLSNSVPPKPTQRLPGGTIEDSQQYDSQVEKLEPDYCAHFSYDPAWANVSDLACDFVRSLLQIDESKRPSASEAKKHKWLHRHRRVLSEIWTVATKDWKPRNQPLSEIWIRGPGGTHGGTLTAVVEEEEEYEDEETQIFSLPRLSAVPGLIHDNLNSDSDLEEISDPSKSSQIIVIPDSQSQKAFSSLPGMSMSIDAPQLPSSLQDMDDMDLDIDEDVEMEMGLVNGMNKAEISGDVEMAYSPEVRKVWDEVAGSGKMVKVSELVRGLEERLVQQKMGSMSEESVGEREMWMESGREYGGSSWGSVMRA